MKLELGKVYLNRAGEKVKIFESTGSTNYPFRCNNRYTYTSDGRFSISVGSIYDLMSEYVEQSSEGLTRVFYESAEGRIQLVDAASRDVLVKHTEILKARIAEQEQQLQAYETQLTLQEEGPKSLLERCERQKRNLDYYAARVAELEAALVESYTAVHNERDQLSAEFKEYRDKVRSDEYEAQLWKERYMNAQAELEALKPKPVVKLLRFRWAENINGEMYLQQHVDGDLHLTLLSGTPIKAELK